MKIIKAEELTNGGQRGIAIFDTSVKFDVNKKYSVLVIKVCNFSESYNYMVYSDVWVYSLYGNNIVADGYYKVRLNFKNVRQFDHKPSKDDVLKEMI